MLAAVERILVDALHADRPCERLRELASVTGDLTEVEAAMLRGIEDDGFTIASLLVRKLRFERVIRGDAENMAWLERDPDGFMEAYARYATAVPPRFVFADEEAAAFRRYRDR